MSLFSSRPVNRRRRVRRRKDSSWIDESGAAKAGAAGAEPRRRKKPATPREQVHQLHAQIGAIESFLHKHHQAEVERVKMKNENILPPPDRSAHSRARRSMTLAEKRRYLARRNRTGFQFLLLFCSAIALGWWIIFSGV